ncbi:MAG TPA: HD domain-containing phosphohydrolase [Deinococcales bacterium]|nr:HD domain-containing phosphohydrolase [Deinococcales bacterium]
MSSAVPAVSPKLAPANWVLGAGGAALYSAACAGSLAWLAFALHVAPPAGPGVLRLFLVVPFVVLLGLSLAYRQSWRLLATLLAAASVLLGLWALLDAVSAGTPLLVTLSTATGAAGGLTLLAAMSAAARHLTGQATAVRHAVERDQLTGLLNRTGLSRRVEEMPPEDGGSLIYLNLNDFQGLNDRAGHDAGDDHLRMIAAQLEGLVPDGGLAARWGGDEFVVLLPEATEAEARELAETLRDALPSLRANLPSFAAGTATFTGGEALDRALATADDHMRREKDDQRTKLSRLSGEAVNLDDFAAQLELLDTPEDILQVGLGTLRVALNFDVSLYFRRQNERFLLAHVDGEGPPALRAMVGRYSAGRGEGMAARAAFENATIWTADYARERDARPDFVNMGIRGLCLAPVRERGRVVALVALANLNGWRSVRPKGRRALEAVASRMGVILERRKAVSEVRRTLEGSLLAIGLALEGRDLETAGHTERVVNLAHHLGRAMGLRGAALEALKQGAYLHDVGKLVVPDSVLLKPGKLDPEEWEQMQAHATRGFDLAARIPTLPGGALEVIRYHHERWDGHGYPDHLVGEAIPLRARIFAVCDVFDALVSARPYKPAWTREQAVAELRARAGTQFDPTVVKAFVELVFNPATAGEELAAVS